MSNLPDGAFLTTINGKQCTAVPKNPRSAAPERTTTAPAPVRTTAPAPQPTQNNNDDQQQDQQPDPQPEPEPEQEPEPEPTSPQEPSSAPDSEVVSSESNSLEDPSTSQAEPPNLAILPTSSTSTSIPSVETQPPEEDNTEGGEPFGEEEEAAPSTSSEFSAPSAVDDAQDTQPSGINQGPVSLELPLLAEADGGSSSSAFLSTATLLAGVSLASPSVSSFFSSSPPSPTGTGTPGSAFSSSFTAILRPSISLSDEDSDSGLLLTDTTPLPDQVVTRPDGKITTIGLAASTARDRDEASETNAPDTNGGAIQSDRNNDDSGPNPALIGGIVGGVVGLAIMAFLVWFCFRRRRKSKRSRFSTHFSTRMSMPPGAEKRRTYEFDSGSVGPTPRRQRFAATLGYHANKFGWGFMMGNQSTNTVNMNRGNSQFLEGLPSHSRGNSTASFDSRANLSRKDRFLDWWSRLKEDVNFNWRLRNGQADSWAIRNMMEKDSSDMEPDFLGLLAKDEKRRSMGNSMHSRGPSVSSIDRFLGDLGMDLDNSRGPNPFSDGNVAPVPKLADPFADTNAIQPTQKPPNTYVADVRRSRGTSIGGAVRASNISTVYRDSVRSNDSFETRRNKCRSDPFDLEIDHRRLPSLENIQAMPSVDTIYGLPPRPGSFKQGGHVSYNSSRYTKASSLGDWSDPGPDVGPSNSTVATTNSWTIKPADAPEAHRPKSRNSGGSQSSAGVGKAL